MSPAGAGAIRYIPKPHKRLAWTILATAGLLSIVLLMSGGSAAHASTRAPVAALSPAWRSFRPTALAGPSPGQGAPLRLACAGKTNLQAAAIVPATPWTRSTPLRSEEGGVHRGREPERWSGRSRRWPVAVLRRGSGNDWEVVAPDRGRNAEVRLSDDEVVMTELIVGCWQFCRRIRSAANGRVSRSERAVDLTEDANEIRAFSCGWAGAISSRGPTTRMGLRGTARRHVRLRAGSRPPVDYTRFGPIMKRVSLASAAGCQGASTGLRAGRGVGEGWPTSRGRAGICVALALSGWRENVPAGNEGARRPDVSFGSPAVAPPGGRRVAGRPMRCQSPKRP